MKSAYKTFAFATLALGATFSLDLVSDSWTSLHDSKSFVAADTAGLLWKSNTNGLPPGHYFASVGRVKGRCSLLSDESEIDNSEGNASLLKQLTLSGEILVTDKHAPVVTISCKDQSGFVGGIADTPAIVPYPLGIALFIYRCLVYLFFGPLLSLYLIVECSSPFGAATYENKYLNRGAQRVLLVFGLIAFAYTCSLSRLPRYFLPNYESTWLHIVLRTSISLAFSEIVRRFYSKAGAASFAFLVILAGDITIGAISFGNPARLVTFYKWHYPLYAFFTLYLWLLILRGQNYRRSILWLQTLTGTWALTQAFDAFATFTDSGTYRSPMMIALITMGVLVLQRKETWLTARCEQAVQRILQAMSADHAIVPILQNTSLTIFEETEFRRLSVYLDSYCLGRTPKPHERFTRVFENGYKKETAFDEDIIFSDSHGNVMAEAMATGRVIFREGLQGDWYCVVPIGKHGCINLSDDSQSDVVSAHESRDIIVRLRPVIDSLADKILAYTIKRNIYLERIKSVRGYGEWPVELGAIMLDVVDFSRQTSHYQALHNGINVYGRFISSIFLPAIVKAVGAIAQLETSEGDKLYLAVLPDLLPPGVSIQEATLATVERIAQFIENDGARLSSESGFEAVKLSIGVYTGQGTIICDEYQVRTVGEAVNFAARLQELAPPGSILAPEFLASQFPLSRYRVTGPRDYLEKKDIITARAIYLRSA